MDDETHRTEHRERLADELCVLACQAGEREAFEALVQRWQARLWRHARHLTGHDDVAWDVLQEAWIAIARGIARLDEVAAFPRWAYTIVTRRAADSLRKQQRQPSTSLDALASDDPQLPPALDERPDDAVGLLREALQHLPAERRALLELHHLEAFDVSEIAVILDIPEGTVKSRLHHARHELRTLIERLDR